MVSLFRFWKRKNKPEPDVRPDYSVPPGRRVYAIGDIHGRDDLFGQLIDRILADHAARGPAQMTLVLLGDLVDRGPQSVAVVERAMNLRREFPAPRLLVGNHEAIGRASCRARVCQYV